jgi:hypothetical protein
MATKKIQTVTVPDPKSGESGASYFNRLMKLQPKATDYGPAEYNVFVSEQMAFTRLATEKLSRFFPAEYDQYVQEGIAYQEGYAAARGAATPSTTTAPPVTTPPTTRPPTTSTPPTTRPPTGTMPPTTAPPTTRPAGTTVPPATTPPATTPPTTKPPTTTVPPTTGTTVPTITGIFGSTPPPAGGTTTTEEENLPPYAPPPRYAKDANGRWYVYEGAGLVTLDGKISEVYYDINNEPGRVYAGMTPAERLEVLGKLNDSGFYTAGNIGNYVSDLNAISAWLEYSNNAGLEKEAALNQIVSTGATMPKPRTGGTPRTYKTSNTDDLKVMAKKISQDTLGRMMSDEELSRFVASYQQSEIDYQKSMYAGRTTEDMQPADIAAQEFSQELAPTEANAYKYLGYVDKFFNSIGGL